MQCLLRGQVYYNYLNVTDDASLKNASESPILYSSLVGNLTMKGELLTRNPKPLSTFDLSA